MVNKKFALEIAKLIYEIDCICRKDFKKDYIVCERDYVSILLNFIRYPFGPFVNAPFVHSQTLSSKLEQNYGCDGIIVFKYRDQYKIGMFEAKIIKDPWDSYVENPSRSRFQRQLDKQKKISSEIAVWEMFINNDKKHCELDLKGSTCVKSEIAFFYKKAKIRWSYKDLIALLQKSYLENFNQPITLKNIIEDILTCKFGKLIEYSEDGFSLFKDEIKMPLIKGDITTYDREKIRKFLKESKMFSYTHFDLGEFEKFKINNFFYESSIPRSIIENL